jgi:rod shape determining protein RodA
MVDRRLLFNMDWVLLGAVALLCCFGVAMIHSATYSGRNARLYVTQIEWVAVGLAVLAVSLLADYRRLVDRSLILYLALIALLIAVLAFGPKVANTRRWFVIPHTHVQLQPSEFGKIVAALLAAKIFSESKKDSLGLSDLVVPGLAIGLMAALISAEPDLGTAVCLVPLFLAVAFLAGIRVKAIVGLALAAVLVAGIGWQFGLREYQKRRVNIFLGIEKDPKGAGYQSDQSQIAVGSGGLTGRGFKHGTQSQLGYLPARHTDFIFSVLAEETGFVGVAAVLGLYLLVLWRGLETAHLARDRVGVFLVAGIMGALSFQVIYNVAMVAGLVPVKGLPLPFMSYGGSSILSSLLAVGLILNVRMRRFAN